MAILVDTGPLVAEADRGDADHLRVRAFFASNREPLLVPVTVLPEVCYLLGRRVGVTAEAAFVRSMGARELTLEPVTVQDLERVAELLETYADARLDFVDACVVAVAERLRINRVATLDHRDFGIIRPRHTAAFELLP